jgi:tRNA-specific 2-thiouridylase
MSGGVDSSVAAALMLDAGHEVVGVTMRLWSEDGAHESDAEASAAETAASLGIPHHVIDLRDEFRKCVVDQFVTEYARGRTPNPCVRCNAEIKFGSLLRYAQEALDADKLATGHYARIGQDHEPSGSGLEPPTANRQPSTENYRLLRAIDRSKDQTYFLYRLTQDQLSRILFPLGGMTKSEVRSIAAHRGIKARERPESQDVCFIPEGPYTDFLIRLAPDLRRPGRIVDTAGKVLGTHNGIAFYTVGQRRGLGIPAKHRLYVVEIDAASNTVVLGPAGDLAKAGVLVDELVLVSGVKLTESVVVSAKIRYNAQDSPALVRPLGDDRAELVFQEPQNAVTPGQSAVFYSGDEVLGGGVIAGIMTADSAGRDGSCPRTG